MFQGQTLQPGTLTEDQMRFTGMARPQGGFGLRGNTAPEMFRDQLTNELVTKAQVDSFGGMQTLLTPSQRSSVAERNRADLFGMQAAQERVAMQPIIQDRRARMDIHLAPPTRPSMENPSGSLGGQIIAGPLQRGDFGMGIQAPPSSRPNPYSAPPQIGGGFGGQMGGGMGGGQGMGQFMQFMQTMMQMFQQIQGGGGRGMGGGFGGPSPFMPQQQQYGQYQPQPAQLRAHQSQSFQPQRMSNQFNPNNAFGGY